MCVFRTWVLTSEPVLEPPELLRKECEKVGLGEDEFLVPALGETVMFWATLDVSVYIQYKPIALSHTSIAHYQICKFKTKLLRAIFMFLI
jgi:hypothetical protein